MVWLAVAALIAGGAAWSYRLKATLDFGFDAAFSRQILAGLNPYEHGVVPRPPSAWLLQLPLAWIDPALLSRIAGAASVVAVSWPAVRLLNVHAMWLSVVAGVVALTHMPRVWWVLAAIPYWVTDGSVLLAPDLGTAMFLSTLIVSASVAVPSHPVEGDPSGYERAAALYDGVFASDERSQRD